MSSFQNKSNEDKKKSKGNKPPVKICLSDLLSAKLKWKRLSLFSAEDNIIINSSGKLPKLETKKYILKELEDDEKAKPKPLT